jgi:hypothetical protein
MFKMNVSLLQGMKLSVPEFPDCPVVKLTTPRRDRVVWYPSDFSMTGHAKT